MTIDQFRAHKFLPAQWAKELQTNGILQAVLQVMEDNHPAHFAVHGDNTGDISPVRAGIELGLTRGYSKYGETLKLLARRADRFPDVGETTYAEPLKEDKQNG